MLSRPHRSLNINVAMHDENEPVAGSDPRNAETHATPQASPPMILQPPILIPPPVEIAAIDRAFQTADEPQVVQATAAAPPQNAPLLLTPARPGPGLFAAIAAIIALFLLQIPFGVVIAVAALLLHASPDSTMLIGLQSAVTLILTLGLARLAMGSNWRHKLAIRIPSFTHILLVSALVLPLSVVDTELGRVLNVSFASFVEGPDRVEPEITDDNMRVGDDDVQGPTNVTERTASNSAAPVGTDNDRLSFLRRILKQIAEYVNGMYGEYSAQTWYFVILAGCMVPAIGEEVFFRGFIGRGLVGRYGLIFGGLTTSIFFGLMHLSPVNIVTTAIIGLALQLVYLSTRSLLTPMLLHFLNNLLAFGAAKLVRSLEFDLLGLESGTPVSPLLLAASLAAIAVIGWLLYDTRVRWIAVEGDWTPGYLTAEMPPAGFNAWPSRGRMRWASIAAGICAVGAFGGAVAKNGLEGSGDWIEVARGNDSFQRGDFEGAVQHFTTAIQRNPESPGHYFNRAVTRERLDDLDGARDDLSRAVELDPNNPERYFDRGQFYSRHKQFDSAIADLTRAIEYQGKSYRYFVARAQAYSENRDLRAALADCDAAIAIAPRRDYGYHIRSYLLTNSHDWAKALADIQSGLEIDPNCSMCFNARAWLFATCPDAEFRNGPQAVADATKACELTNWQDPARIDTLAAAYAESANFEQAIRWQERAIELAAAPVPPDTDPRDRTDYQSRLDRYRNHQTYTEDP